MSSYIYFKTTKCKKKNILKENLRENLRWLHESVSNMAAQFNGRNGTETLLCDVIVVLNIAAFLRQ